jgi:uncharacterized membrane protein
MKKHPYNSTLTFIGDLFGAIIAAGLVFAAISYLLGC